MDNIIPVITIDGPSGSGKGTLSRKLACILGWNLLDSGIIYRVLVLVALENGIDLNNEEKLQILIPYIKISFIKKMDHFDIFCNNKQIKKNIYTEVIGNYASKIAVFPKVRDALLLYQRKFCLSPGLVADGRDMGTIVFPNALVKIFLYASIQEREQRRLDQLHKINFNVKVKNMSLHVTERDERDCNRKIAPLVPASGALILDSTFLSKTEVENQVWLYIQKTLIVNKFT